MARLIAAIHGHQAWCLVFVKLAALRESVSRVQGCVFTQDVNQAIIISDAMETGTVQVNAAPARGPDHFPFQGFRDSGIGTQARHGLHALMRLNINCVPVARSPSRVSSRSAVHGRT